MAALALIYHGDNEIPRPNEFMIWVVGAAPPALALIYHPLRAGTPALPGAGFILAPLAVGNWVPWVL